MEKIVIMDDGGRITISKEFREILKIQKGDKIVIKKLGKFLTISKKNDLPEVLSFEFLYNKIVDLEKENALLNSRFNELRQMAINKAMSD